MIPSEQIRLRGPALRARVRTRPSRPDTCTLTTTQQPPAHTSLFLSHSRRPSVRSATSSRRARVTSRGQTCTASLASSLDRRRGSRTLRQIRTRASRGAKTRCSTICSTPQSTSVRGARAYCVSRASHFLFMPAPPLPNTCVSTTIKEGTKMIFAGVRRKRTRRRAV